MKRRKLTMDEKEFIRSGKKQPIRSFFRRIFSRKKKEQPIEAKHADILDNVVPFPTDRVPIECKQDEVPKIKELQIRLWELKAELSELKEKSHTTHSENEKVRGLERDIDYILQKIHGISKEEIVEKLRELGDNFDKIEDLLELPVDRLFSFGCGFSEKRFEDSFRLAREIEIRGFRRPKAEDTVFTIGINDCKNVVYAMIVDPYRRILVSAEFERRGEDIYSEYSGKKTYHSDWSDLASSLRKALELKEKADQAGEKYNFVVCRGYEAYLDKTGIEKNEISKEKKCKRQENNARKEGKAQKSGWSSSKVIEHLKSWPSDLDDETINMMQIPEGLYEAPNAYFELNEEPGVRDGDKIKFAIRVPLLVEGGVAPNPVLNEITAYSLGFIADGSHTYFFLSDPKRNLFLYEMVCTDVYPESTSWKGVQRALRKAVDKNKSSR